MAETYCTAFMEDLPPEKQAEGLGVQAAVILGECLPYGANYCPNCGAKMDGGYENA